jgi:hypothetical protein
MLPFFSMGFQFQLPPWRRGFNFIVTSNVHTSVLCTEDGSMYRVEGP